MIWSFIRISAAAALAVALPATAQAQAQSIAEPNTVTVTPFLSTSFGVSHELGSSLGLGAAVGYDWTRNLGFEFEVGRVFDIASDGDTVDLSLTNISGSVIYHFDVPRVTPYGVFGLGWERPDLDVDDGPDLDLTVEPSTEMAWHIGGGVKYPLTPRLIARADLRRFQANDDAPDHWRLYGGITFWIKR